MIKKGNIAVRKVWSLGERRLKGDFKKRRLLFNYLMSCRMRLRYGAGAR